MDTVKKRKNPIAILFLAMLGVLGGLQLWNQPLEGKPVTKKIEAPREVISILENSCFSCHSNQQNLSWYDQIAPFSWAVNKDIKRAREVLNFSEWEKKSPAEHKGNMYAILNMMQSGKMPLHEYTLLHPSAKITKKDIETIKKYTLSLSPVNPAAQHKKEPQQSPTSSAAAPTKLPVSPN
ncbi:heme-binding domain-containing protein [Chryseobacterium pennipullorum]|uniref:heme-binding domain-containing protein n=1 Tax=Chryseobacterium pennipullorum TaxID=2258963 RepID=UPI001E5A1F9D|nr:heme-binding domain-containing protein [Chryseobacterium pennipullorum]